MHNCGETHNFDIDIPTKGNDYRYLIPGKNF